MATGQDALSNILAGNVALESNQRLTVSSIRAEYANSYIDSWSTGVMEVDTSNYNNYDENNPNYAIIYFKDGSSFFVTQTSHPYMFAYYLNDISKTPIGEAAGNNKLPYTTRLVFESLPNTRNVTVGTTSETCNIMSYRFSFARVYAWNSAETQNQLSFSAIAYTFRGTILGDFRQNDDSYLIYLSYLRVARNEDIVDYFAGDSAEPTGFPGDNSTTGGGGGLFYAENDGVAIPDLPSIQAIDFGFTSIYNPSIENMQAISNWLWSDDFSENIKKNFVSPFENILALAIVPLHVSSVSASFKIGNVSIPEINVPKVTSQYITLDCGTRNILEYWGGFLDYDATYSIWLPFIGYRSLKTDDIVNGSIGVIYHIDLLTGAAVCFITSTKEDNILNVLYTYSCNIFYSVALSGANYISMYNQQLSATVSGINNAASSIGRVASGDIVGGLTSFFTGQAMTKREYETAKPDYGRGGNSGGNSGLFSVRYPYIIQSLPIGQVPKNYKSLQGIPSQIYSKLDVLSGYTEVETVIIDTLINCTDDEKEEIYNILRQGVIL